ncbi:MULTISPECIES: ABC transporter ATP-binding protein [Nocardiaceae]|uniref:Iron complex transport system ATP-binding protein n=1 Tax=Rhodococcoides corynebacterioides TaxID=53972 RepID=A0ABS2KNA4_9NOCA|nr:MULTISPECIES: ABC transporter ATP-binding protein [Rhodococcus]MBM7413453.1 iron complex transport system ATP-binding protein [Rhodococcus corynebacterioides]MBP1115916.1 iron complex transport system ATP-binding protein [Rhodococcus sp. PvP016]
MTLHAWDVSWKRGAALVVDGVTLAPEPGDVVGLLGPNGSGKSSLLQLLSGATNPSSGVVHLDGDDVSSLRRREVARAVAVVDQDTHTDVDVTVRDVVRLGRIPHRGMFGGSDGDELAVSEALAHTGLEDKADRLWRRLSGGERQRVHIARALAQQPRELLLDEPTNHLDIHHQLEILALVARLPITSVVALHDLNLAAMFCDRVMVLKDGRTVTAGTPEEVLTEELIADVYGVRARVSVDEPGGRVHVRFEPGAVQRVSAR